MSRLDNFGEILDSYEGREPDADILRNLRAALDPFSRETYDSLDPENQKKVLKYFYYAKKTGKIKAVDGRKVLMADLEAFRNFFNEFFCDIEEDDNTEEEISIMLDKLIESYEKDEQTR